MRFNPLTETETQQTVKLTLSSSDQPAEADNPKEPICKKSKPSLNDPNRPHIPSSYYNLKQRSNQNETGCAKYSARPASSCLDFFQRSWLPSPPVER